MDNPMLSSLEVSTSLEDVSMPRSTMAPGPLDAGLGLPISQTTQMLDGRDLIITPAVTTAIDDSAGETVLRIEAETMDLSGYNLESTYAASEGDLISLLGGNGSGSASFKFSGPAATYDIAVGYFDENDGTAELQFDLNGEVFGDFRLDRQLSANVATPKSFAKQVVGQSLDLQAGDVITLTGRRNREEFARVDYIELTKMGSSGPEPAPIADPQPDPTPTPTPEPPSDAADGGQTIRLEAEDLSLQNYVKEGTGVASGGQLIKLSGSQGSATGTFQGESGLYDLVLGYHDEMDGQGSVQVQVGDRTYEVELDQLLGDTVATAKNAQAQQMATQIEVRTGDSITITGMKDAEEYARVDYLEFVGAAGPQPGTPEPEPPVVNPDPVIIPEPGPEPRPEPPLPGQPSGNFQVVGSKIYDPSGTEYIAKGVNVNGYQWVWPESTADDAPQIVDDWGFNMIRVNSFLGDTKWPQFSDNNNTDEIVNEFTSQDVVVMLEVHDKTGGYWDGSNLEQLKNYWRSEAKKHKDNPYVWFNIANEPGGLDSAQKSDRWVEMHQEVIKVIRDEVGAQNVIVADGHYWGQDLGEWDTSGVDKQDSAIIAHGDKLKSFDGKDYDNIVFSVHMYDQWMFGQDKMREYFDAVEDEGHAIIVGEYGVHNGNQNTTKVVRDMFPVVQEREIGRVAWSWWGGDSNNLTTGGGGHHYNGSNLTEFGRLIMRDNQRSEDLEQL